jgi:hypothetical protein
LVRFVILLILGTIGIAYLAAGGDRVKSNALMGTWRKILVADSPGCADVERLDKLHEYLDQGDPAAYQRGLGEAKLSGECILYTYGQEVYVIDAARSKVKLRLRGDTSEYWASHLALEQPAK